MARLFLVSVFVLLVPWLGWSQAAPHPRPSPIEVSFRRGTLVAIGSVPASDWDTYGSLTPQVDYQKLLNGGYQDKMVEIDGVPFSWVQESGGHYRYWAYGTDDTGFGWREGEPILVLAASPLTVEGPLARFHVLSVPSGFEQEVLFDRGAGEPLWRRIPVFTVVTPPPP